MKLTPRQIKLLGIIVDGHTFSAQPISSKEIIKDYMSDVSSATIRNEMAKLEKFGLLEKTHTSSGRVPSINGYKYYEENILKPKISTNIQNKLKKVFSQRDASIDSVLDQSVTIMNETLKLPSVMINSQNHELLKRFDLIQIDEKTALVLLVTSSGSVNKTTLKLDSKKQLDDISTCIRIFNDRLVNTALKDVFDKLDAVKEIIRSMVHEYEFCIQQVIEKIFNFNKTNINQNVTGTKWLTTHPEFQNVKKLEKALQLLEDTNVWKHISYNQQKTGKTLITFGKEFGANDLAVASTTINTNNSSHQLSVVGPTRMNYAEVKGLLEFIKNEIEEIEVK